MRSSDTALSSFGSLEPATVAHEGPRTARQPAIDRRRWLGSALLCALALIITSGMQEWVGGSTIYHADREADRARLHQAILENRLPEGASSWNAVGANGSNLRIAVVYAAEAIVRTTGLPLARAYRGIDSLALFASLLLLFVLLRRWHSPTVAVVGVLYTSAVLPLTYALHYFHPWDRLSLLMWLVLLLLLERGLIGFFAVALAASIAVKYDTVLLPLLYFLANVQRETWRRVMLTTAGLAVASFGALFLLSALLPGGSEPRLVGAQMARNLADLRAHHVHYPPLLALGLPFALALLGYSRIDRFGRACVLFAMPMIAILLALTNFVEVRAEMMILVLLTPAALTGGAGVLASVEHHSAARPTVAPEGSARVVDGE